MESKLADVTLCRSELTPPGAHLHGTTQPNGTHTSIGTAVIATCAASSAEHAPAEVYTSIAQTTVQAPAGHFTVSDTNTSSTQNHIFSSISDVEAVNVQSHSSHADFPVHSMQELGRMHAASNQNPLHSTMVNNFIDGNRTTYDFGQQCQTLQGQTIQPTSDGFPFSGNPFCHLYGPNNHGVSTTVPVWSRSMPCPSLQPLPFGNLCLPVSNNIYGSAATAPPPRSIFAPTMNSGWCCFTPATIYNNTATAVQMPSPIAAPFAQPNLMTSNINGNLGGAMHSNVNLRQMHSIAPELILSSSQIASRQVINKDLPVFSGRPEEWPLFITNYIQSTERCGFSDQENLLRLQKCLKGPALEAVRGKLMMPNTVSCAIETLKMLFGRADVIHQTMQCKLRQEPAVKSDKLENLIHFALSVQNYCSTIEAIGLVDYLNDPVLLAELVGKLPNDLKLDWGRHQMTLVRVNISAFDKWLFALASCASQVTTIGPMLSTPSSEAKTSSRHPRPRILIHDVVDQNRNATSQQVSCPKCKQEHRLSDCSEFLALNTDQRWKFVRERGLCIRCFRKHLIRRCNSRRQCGVDGCQMSHHYLLHTSTQRQRQQIEVSDSHQEQEEDSAEGYVADRVVSFHSNDQRRAMFRYVPVTLYGGGRSVETYALIDEGSACTLMECGVADELGLDGPSEELCLRWTGDITQNEVNSKVVSLNISSRETDAPRFSLKNVRTVSKLDLPMQSLDASLLKGRSHLRKLPILPYKDAQARILIGLDNAKIGMPLETRQEDNDELIAARCRIGWAVYGRNGISESASQRVMHVCQCNSANKMDEMLKAYFSLDSIGVSKTPPLDSKENERAHRIMESSSKYIPSEKRWETGLLWKYDTINLPNSLPMARRRLQCLEAKMERDPDLREYLVQTIRSYEEKGYVRKLKREEISSGGKSWYIPIFTVTNPNKNKKRLVWDAAAKAYDVSLNMNLMKGPDLLTSLVGVLIRFRERPVALCGDIREMFHQVLVRKEDQIAQQFLWREGDSSKEPDVFAMLVMTFGASCSPSLANYIKNRNANRWKNDHPEAVGAIIRNTYVDDWLQSAGTEDEMIEMARIVRHIHSEGGFEMRNWSSNSRRVLAALTGETAQEGKCIEEFNSVHEKVLGLWWRSDTDELTFFEKFDKRIFDESSFPTKREILRIVMTIFDPLGLLGFYVIQAKVILQNIWRSGVSWDEPVQDDEREEWWQWIRQLPLISTMQLPRCYPLVNNSDNVELHTFVDASINAYAAVSYLRVEVNGEVQCCLVASKTRVAPLKPVSIPRLELMAAILGLRLAKFICGEMSVRVKRRFFWTDSKNVLYWIRSDARKFHQFVALRIGEILEDSDVSEWRWVPTAHNVADEGTKWSKNVQFDSQSRWFCGPEFLVLPECNWPETKLNYHADTELGIVCHVDLKRATVSTLSVIVPDPNRFSKWERLRSAQRYVLQFLNKIVKQPSRLDHMKIVIESRDISVAEAVIMRACQEEVFTEELACLRSGSNLVSRKSYIFKCSPYLDDFGLLRVRGRVDLAQCIAVDIKRPVILPRNHQVTRLIVDFYHRKFHHHHNEIVVNEIRQRFFISCLRVLVRAVARDCQWCRNRRASPAPPTMGNLPRERLAAFTLPFTYTGVDYFGPMDVAVGRRREKRWGVLFTCLTTRAVHIEISPSLSTESFLLVLKQFISRRGVPRRILSDNGTNFRGASRILMEEIEKVSADQLEKKYPEIEWAFIPPASPHMGGAWERMIRSVKSILMDILHDTSLREEVLRATLADIECILNSRPLTYVPLDSLESEALTPNHFLVGSSTGIRERGSEVNSGSILRRNFNLSNQLANQFWKRWVREYLPCLTRRTKWFQPPLDPIAVDDVVIIVDENSKRNTWRKGIVVDLRHSTDGEARSAVVKTVDGLLTRPIVKLAKIDVKGVNIAQGNARHLQRGECCDATRQHTPEMQVTSN